VSLLTSAAVRPKEIIGIAEMAVSRDPEALLVTYALGSCIGVALFDPVARVGGLLHAMLPTSSLDRERALKNPERFVDTGVPALFKACYRLGAEKHRIVVKVAGGARMVGTNGRDSFQTGKRNVLMFKKLLWKNGVLLKGEDTGDSLSRTVTLDLATGEFLVKTSTGIRPI
jgi:chemotaxis protein CheD